MKEKAKYYQLFEQLKKIFSKGSTKTASAFPGKTKWPKSSP